MEPQVPEPSFPRRLLHFALAAAAAPVLTFWLSLAVFFGGDVLDGLAGPLKVAAGLFFFGAVALVLGFVGSAVLLLASFRLLRLYGFWGGRVGAFACALAGLSAGGMHVTLAWIAAAKGLPGVEGPLGLYFIREAFETSPPLIALTPLAAGALVGAGYFALSRPGLRWSRASRANFPAQALVLALLVTPSAHAAWRTTQEWLPLRGPCRSASAVRIEVEGVVYRIPAALQPRLTARKRERGLRVLGDPSHLTYCQTSDAAPTPVGSFSLTAETLTAIARADPERFPQLAGADGVHVTEVSRDPRVTSPARGADEAEGPPMFARPTRVRCSPESAYGAARCGMIGAGPGGGMVQFGAGAAAPDLAARPALTSEVEDLLGALSGSRPALRKNLNQAGGR